MLRFVFIILFLIPLSLRAETNYQILYGIFMNQAEIVSSDLLTSGHRHMECFDKNENAGSTKVFWVHKSGGGLLPVRTYLSYRNYDLSWEGDRITPYWKEVTEAQVNTDYQYLYSQTYGWGIVAVKKYETQLLVWLQRPQMLCTLQK